MTEPTPPKSDLASSLAEGAGLVLVSVAAFFVAVPLGLAVAGAALFCLGYFGLAR